MITLISHLQDYISKGSFSQFLIYSIFTWSVMLPRSLCAGIFYSCRPGFKFQVNNAYIISCFICGLQFVLINYFLNEYNFLSKLILNFFSLSIIILVLIPSLGRNTLSSIFKWTPYKKHQNILRKKSLKQWKPELNLGYITIFDPPCLIEFEKKLKKIRECFDASNAPFILFAVIDGKNAYKNSDNAIAIAKKYCQVVGAGNAQRKRVNLKWMIHQSWDLGLINNSNKGKVIVHFIDDDTIPGSLSLVDSLTSNFINPKIGGVTTAQYINNPRNFWQKTMQIFESARNYGSQAGLSLFGSVGCMPGRWYCVRSKYLTKKFANYLSKETISFFGLSPRLRDPGDDRLITILVQINNGLTIMEPDAVIYTEGPSSFLELWGMVTRWARSSNIYTIQYSLPMLKKLHCFPTLFVYWSNIILAFTTVYISIPYFIYRLFYGTREINIFYAILLMFLGMFLTMTIRQLGLISTSFKYLKWMFILGPMGIFMQIVQVWGILTYMKSKWTGMRRMGLGKTSENIDLEKSLFYP